MILHDWLIQHLGGRRILVRAHQQRRRRDYSAVVVGPPTFDLRVYTSVPERDRECIEIKLFYEAAGDGAGRMSLNMSRPYSLENPVHFQTLTNGWSPEWREQRQVVFTSTIGRHPVANPLFMEELARVQGALEMMGTFGIEGFEVASDTAARIGALRVETHRGQRLHAPPDFLS